MRHCKPVNQRNVGSADGTRHVIPTEKMGGKKLKFKRKHTAKTTTLKKHKNNFYNINILYYNIIILKVSLQVSRLKGNTVISKILATLVPTATLRGVAKLHVASGMPQWRIFVTCCYL